MGNNRQWTTKFNANNDQLAAFVKARAGRSTVKRREAMERAATMPNRIPPSRRSTLIQGEIQRRQVGAESGLVRSQQGQGSQKSERKPMPKDLTVKDVLYALEYLNDALLRTPISDGNARWHLRSGATVKEAVANAVRASGRVDAFDGCGRQAITWRQVA